MRGTSRSTTPRRAALAGRRLAGLARRRLLTWLARAGHTVEPGTVALTYDDGPHPAFTPTLLDILDEADARATFFVVGERAEAHPEIVRRMVDEGHSVGTHSMRHADLHRIRRAAARDEIDRGRVAVERILGRSVPLFRPPKGHLTFASALFLRSRRWHTMLWTTDSLDWKDGIGSEAVVSNALNVGDGGVVLLHDTAQVSLDATRSLIARLRERHLQLVGL
jgi:peptidoglycan-N-acetylglucosamine deacetylase